jgi:hypothetical protein
LRSLRKRVRDLGLQNVTISLGEPHDTRLPADSVDVAILVHMYHEITQPYALLYNLVPALIGGVALLFVMPDWADDISNRTIRFQKSSSRRAGFRHEVLGGTGT